MNQHINTIREALEELDDQYNNRKWMAIAALDALEQAMKTPVAWQWLDTAVFRRKIPPTGEAECWGPVFAAPPQQPEAQYTAADMATASADGFRAGQQAQADAVPQPPEDWSVFNTGAEVASGLTWAEAWDYMTPGRIARGWTAVCVANKDNLPAAPQHKGGV